jgi:hypothetical protein
VQLQLNVRDARALRIGELLDLRVGELDVPLGRLRNARDGGVDSSLRHAALRS